MTGLVSYTVTALAESDSQGTDNKNIVENSSIKLFGQPSDTLTTIFDDAAGSNPETEKFTNTNGYRVIYAPPGDYRLSVNNVDFFVTLAEDASKYSIGVDEGLSWPNALDLSDFTSVVPWVNYTITANTPYAGDNIPVSDTLDLDASVTYEGNINGYGSLKFTDARSSDVYVRGYNNGVPNTEWVKINGSDVFNTIADLKASTSLQVGDWVETKGALTANDGGSANFYVLPAGISDEVLTYDLANGLRAEIQQEDGAYNAKALGLVDDGATSNTVRMEEILSVITNAEILFPVAEDNYRFTDTIEIPKATEIKLKGVISNRGNRSGSKLDFDFSGSSKVGLERIAIKIGVADGNPDVTGFASDVYIEGLSLTTDNQTAHVCFDITNTRYFQLTKNSCLGWRERVINANGGNIIGKVENNELFGRTNNDTGIYAIYHGEYQFGNFDVQYLRNHISNCNYIAKPGEGRDFRFHFNTVDGAGTGGFDMTGQRAVNIWINNNYFEAVRGTLFDQQGASPNNTIYNLSFDNNEIWLNSQGGPTFGDLTRVNNYTQNNSFTPTDQIKLEDPSLGLSGTYTTGNPMAPDRSVRYHSENYDYEVALTEGLLTGELIQAAGLFGELQGSGSSTSPLGWTAGDPATWTVEDSQIGRCARYTTNGTFIVCEKVINITPLATGVAPRIQLIYTARGWLGCEITPNGGTTIPTFDEASSEFNTIFATVTLPVGTTQFTVRLLTDQVTVDVAEFKLWQVSGFDASFGNGRLAQALQRATVKQLVRGYYGDQIS